MDQARDVLEPGPAAFRKQQRQEVDLEQQIAELVGELRVVARDRSVGDLVRLLDRMWHDRASGLLTVPRTVAAQPLGQLLEVFERLAEAH